ncbi:hypothetical protein LUZ60_005201 [Juncus effusus]|nr:hypothetical protein LUZ60_005201 [Juncus effusus]
MLDTKSHILLAIISSQNPTFLLSSDLPSSLSVKLDSKWPRAHLPSFKYSTTIFHNQSNKLPCTTLSSLQMDGPSVKVSLRPFTLSDLDDFFVWASDDRVSAHCRWDTYTSKDDLLNYMKSGVLGHPWMRAICLHGRPVGAISVTPNTGEDRCRAELGYVLASEHWGKGIATEAVKLVLRTIFEDLKGLERVEALVDIENVGSQRVLQKAGFVKDGVLRRYLIHKGRVRDMVLFSFICTDEIV